MHFKLIKVSFKINKDMLFVNTITEHEEYNNVVSENNQCRMQQIISINSIRFEEAFHDHYEGLFRYACTLVREAEEAEDILQNVFLELWKNRESLLIHTSLQAYLYKAVYFKCVNVIEHRKVRHKHANHVQYREIAYTSDPVLVKEVSAKIQAVTDSLPEQCRKIFMMSRNDGLRYHEIAERLNLSVKTIENQMGKALRILRNSLQDYLNLIVFYSISLIS